MRYTSAFNAGLRLAGAERYRVASVVSAFQLAESGKKQCGATSATHREKNLLAGVLAAAILIRAAPPNDSVKPLPALGR